MAFVDVTDRFFKGVAAMEPGRVILTPEFDMLEGARALEIGNPRLDTGMIKLSEETLRFDTSQGQSLAQVTTIMDQILVLCMTWMKGSPLSVTVLSCRYVVDLLSNYKEKKLLKNATFVCQRLHQEGYSVSDSTESQYVNTVLRAYILGVAKFIGFAVRLGSEVLYEEEDMVLQTLGLDFLAQTSPQIVLAEIEAAERWLGNSKEAKSDKKFISAMYFLRLAKQLTCFDDMMALGINLFHPQKFGGLAFLKQAVTVVDLLQKSEQKEDMSLAFSTFVQLDHDNNNNPSQNVAMDRDEAYKSFARFLRTVNNIVTRFTSLSNYTQFQQFLEHYVCHDLAVNDCALARGIFQMFLIRDDKSIVGSNEDVSSIGLKAMEHISLCGNSIMDPASWSFKKTTEEGAKRAEFSNRLVDLFNDIETATYHELSLFANNRCRQRQLRNRNIVILDTLQHKSETLEIDLFDCGIGDVLPGDNGIEPALGISSFLYYKKLETMIDVVLSGFELQVYQAREATMMLFYASELAAHMNLHISTRIVVINYAKLLSISSLKHDIKRAKGKGLENLKAQHHYLESTCAPILESNKNYFMNFAVPAKSALQNMCVGIAIVIMLTQNKLDEEKNDKKAKGKGDSLVETEQLYNLRMKPYASVGSPPPPEYEHYTKFIEFIQTEETQAKDKARESLQEAIKNLQKLLSNLNSNAELRARLVSADSTEIEDYYRKLQATARVYLYQLDSLGEQNQGTLQSYDLFLPQFPMFSFEKAGPEMLEKARLSSGLE